MWSPFDDGATIGQLGSESGAITRDEEHACGARITLERDAAMASFTITCGIYALMAHTRFFHDEAEANGAYEAMKPALDAILQKDESEDIYVLLDAFLAQFP